MNDTAKYKTRLRSRWRAKQYIMETEQSIITHRKEIGGKQNKCLQLHDILKNFYKNCKDFHDIHGNNDKYANHKACNRVFGFYKHIVIFSVKNDVRKDFKILRQTKTHLLFKYGNAPSFVTRLIKKMLQLLEWQILTHLLCYMQICNEHFELWISYLIFLPLMREKT
uniref:Uncharacterized protein n=1 Tax=Glossina austeni TaxID=7395 RepID=A0A1A9UVM5_GLOAU